MYVGEGKCLFTEAIFGVSGAFLEELILWISLTQ